MKKHFPHVLFAALVICLCGCSTLQEALNMANCKYKLNNIANVIWGNVNLTKIKSISDVTVADAAKLAAAVLKKDFNVKFTTNILASNSTAMPASLGGFDYIFQLEGNDVLSGEHNQKVSIPANSTQVIPLTLNVDARKLLKKETRDDMINLVQNITKYGNGEASNVALKIRPWIINQITGQTNKSLPYIKLNKTLQ